ncbi:uncharacterized protein LOC114363962 [Ostrinia furnacalis]|uniref:uncharacterized protein LOC114363962 n=1 Tax=Ostrinia furnacalis TaxID=93504 RepID=UPI0010388A01|nr:uncharacterized protein LOC114363962 [Ostrinia furnacalis]
MAVQTIPYHQRYPWKANPNNAFSKPQHPYFQQMRMHQQQRPVAQTKPEMEDVSMRTAPQLKQNQINLGKGYVAEEVFYHPEASELEHYEEYEEYPLLYLENMV